MSELRFHLRGLGLWAPGYPDPRAWAARPPACPEDPGATPRAELLPPMLRRRTSLLTRMSAEVARQALRGLPPGPTTMVYGSVYGEIRTTLELLAALVAGPEPLSPTRFHNSVHNTAAGYVSIATANHAGNSVLAAGRSTLAMALLDCAALVACGGGDAVLVIAEEPLPEPLAAGRRYGPFAAAFALSALAPPDRSEETWSCRLVRGRSDAAPPHAPPPWLAESPVVAALGLVDGLLRGDPLVALEPHLAEGWLCEVAR